MENLNKDNINDQNYIPFLSTFPLYKLDVLNKNGIINDENFHQLINLIANNNDDVNDQFLSDDSYYLNPETKIEEILSGDKLKELQELIQNEDINTFYTIIIPFKEVAKMKISLIQYCIMKNAIKCFKFFLVNGYEDPKKTLEEALNFWENKHRYQWDCMALDFWEQ